MKVILRERNQRGFADEPMLAATQRHGVIRKDRYEARTVEAQKDLHLLKLVRVGDFVISLRSFEGGIEYAMEQGIISPAYTVLTPTDPDATGYLRWLFKSHPFLGNLSLHVTGIREGQNINYERLARAEVPLPPANEQAAIVRFLDHADRRIRRYITAKRKLIALLNERQVALVDRAVGRGLDTSVPLKAAGVDGLGPIPQYWTVARLRNLVSYVTSGSRGWSNFASDEGPLFLRVGNLTRASIDLELNDAMRLNLPNTSEAIRARVQPGDVLLSITAYIGSVAVVPDGIGEAYVSQHVALCRRLPDGNDSRWIGYFLLSSAGKRAGQLRLYGGTKAGLSLDDVKDFPVLLPPPAEQVAIARSLDVRLARGETTRRRISDEIDLLIEYRARLVSDVITGKIDVRDAASRLSPESEEVGAFADLGAGMEAHEAAMDEGSDDDAEREFA